MTANSMGYQRMFYLLLVVFARLDVTVQTPEENISVNKPVSVTPEGSCTDGCAGGPASSERSCIKCNSTCLSGVTDPPDTIGLDTIPPCANQAVRDSRLSTPPNNLHQTIVQLAFTNNSADCPITQTLTDAENSFTVAFWIQAKDLTCNPPSENCYVHVLRISNPNRDIGSVQIGPNGLRINSTSDGTEDSPARDDYSKWTHITVLVSNGISLAAVPNSDDPSVTLSPLIKKVNWQESGSLKVVWGPNNGLSGGIFAIAGINIYNRAISGRQISRLAGHPVSDPRIDPDCRCHVPSFLESGALMCTSIFGPEVERVNQDAHFIEYVNDGDEATGWISPPQTESNITINLGARYQVISITVKFGSSLPAEVVVERILGSRVSRNSPTLSGDSIEVTWDLSQSRRDRAAYTETLAESVRLLLQGHADSNTNYHSVAEIVVFGRKACYVTQTNPESLCTCPADNNKTTPYCEECAKGYFHMGSFTCQSCECHRFGSDGNCDEMTGECVCLDGRKVKGNRCDTCQAFYYNLTSSGCTLCECDPGGTRSCNATTGQCYCYDNVEGDRCDTCKAEHYWSKVPMKGCEPCECDEEGSKNMGCDMTSGQCPCKPNLGGRDCSSCDPGYWNFPSCEECPECNVLGSVNRTTCDNDTGKCFCVGGVQPNNICSPVIEDLIPAYGPKAGGTRVSVIGQLLGEGINFTVYLNDVQQTSISRNHTLLVFETKNSTDILTENNVRVDLGEGVGVENGSETFTYRENPTVTEVYSPSSIASGGITVTIKGSHLDSVWRPVLRAYSSEGDLKASEPCLIEPRNATTLLCFTPNLTDSHKGEKSDFLLGLEFDGFQDYLRLPESMGILTVYNDPVIQTWDSKDFTYPFNQAIDIQGDNLTLVVKESDYTVMVGSAVCVISQLSNTKITCTPPRTRPVLDDPNSDQPNVVVKVGFLRWTVGRLNYIPYYRSKEFIGILSGVGGLFILIVVLVVVKKCRQGHRRAVPAEQKTVKPIRVSVGADNGSAGNDQPPSVPRYTPYPVPSASLFDRLETDTQSSIESIKVTRDAFKFGRLCTKKGKMARIIDGEFTNKSPISPGRKLTIKAFVKDVPENQAVPPWVNQAIKDAITFEHCKHANILELLGVGFDRTKAYILYPHMSNRSLKDYIINPKINIMHNQLLEFSLQIAEGMEYLSSQGIEHRDLATRNCMVDEDFVVKIGDISFSKDLYKSEYVFDKGYYMYLPLRWMALEYLEHGFHDVRSDVWSYGVVVWELFTRGTLPYHDVQDSRVKEFVKNDGRPFQVENVPARLDELMGQCWDKDPARRPTFTRIVDDIKEIAGVAAPAYENDNSDDNGDYFNMMPGRNRASSFYHNTDNNIYSNVPLMPGGHEGRSSRRLH